MYLGPIVCPKCELPIEDNAQMCPHCYSFAPASAPWNRGAWTNVLLLGVVFIVLLGVDVFAGTKIVPTIWSLLQANNSE
jgi:hypothetical protein